MLEYEAPTLWSQVNTASVQVHVAMMRISASAEDFRKPMPVAVMLWKIVGKMRTALCLSRF
jgi:hypothetical protein